MTISSINEAEMLDIGNRYYLPYKLRDREIFGKSRLELALLCAWAVLGITLTFAALWVGLEIGLY
jgi:hypothetical protein